MGDTIPMPERGITLADGWWACILWAGKDVENRNPGTAARLRGWRGTLLLTASKACDIADIVGVWKESLRLAREHATALGKPDPYTGPNPLTPRMLQERAGHAVGVVDLVGTRRNPLDDLDDLWSVRGQDGLLLANPRPIKPVPWSGGRGVWYPGRCIGCGLLAARENMGDPCRRCKGTAWDKPALEVA